MENSTRVGVFFCTCNGKIAEKADYKPVITEIKKLPQVDYILESQSLCTQTEGEQIGAEIVNQKINRIVIAGCAGAKEEGFFKEIMIKAGVNPHLLSMVNLLGECCAVHNRGVQADEKALEMIKMGIARACKLEEVLYQRVPVNRTALIVGGGIAGIETAIELAARGFKIVIIEKENKLGGRLSRLNSLVGFDSKPREIIEAKIKNLSDNPLIEINTGVKLVDVECDVYNTMGRFRAWFIQNEQEKSVEVGAIILATGVQTIFCPVKHGLGVADNVIGQMRLERLLIRGQDFTRKRLSFIVGKGTENSNLPFVMALKNALLLRRKFNTIVNIFYTNIKVGGDNWEKLYTEARDAGVNFFKYEDNIEVSANNGEITVSYEDPYLKGKITGTYKITSDYIVFPEELIPSEGTEELASMLGLELGSTTFFSLDNPHLLPGDTTRDGIYLVGSCQFPGFVNDIEVSVKAVAQEISRKLSAGEVTIPSTQPYVDAAKCVVCLTCYRCCPHGAITIDHDEQYNNLYNSVAQMNPLACRKCGICAAECPGKAIQLPDYTDDQVLAQLEAMEVRP